MQRSAAVYAFVSAGHVFGIALLVGPILLVDLRLAGMLRALDAPSVAVLRNAARLGVVVALATGILLLSAKPEEYFANRIVWAKLIVIAAGLANATAFEIRAARAGLPAMLERGGPAFGLVSIVLWIAALLLGRWIAFV